MKIIKELAEMIREEMEDAEEYAKHAVLHKEDDSELAQMFYELSRQELEHANREHEQAVRIIQEKGEPAPAAMQAVWDWEHQVMIDKTAKIKALQELYRA